MECEAKMDNTERLMCFGLTRQEAKIYVLLLSEGALSGYEAAKRTGISRSNAYAALAGLAEKGAAYVAKEQAVQYHAVPVKEFCENKLHYFREMAEVLTTQLPQNVLRDENYLTIRGERHIEDKFRNMLRETKERVYLSVPPAVADKFRDELLALIAKNKKVVLLTRAPYELPGAICYDTDREDGQLRLITDSSYALTGELVPERECACLYSANPNLVKLLKDALANEIKLIQLKR